MSSLEGYKFTPTHEWVKVTSVNKARIGISDFAQKELSDVVFIELPKVGAQINKGKECGVIESVKTASDLYSPVSGKVAAVNVVLNDNPGLVNNSPYDQGWIFEIELSAPAELDKLMNFADYEKTVH